MNKQTKKFLLNLLQFCFFEQKFEARCDILESKDWSLHGCQYPHKGERKRYKSSLFRTARPLNFVCSADKRRKTQMYDIHMQNDAEVHNYRYCHLKS